ncbi:MAG TPA: TonB-dependent receptor [Gemmatimonadaceae bacterium]|jgi:outer membrane receptor for ferrienterochelin and colicin|nr:TonB-dependent receptor [Gemmatimonadaceae bacterium]
MRISRWLLGVAAAFVAVVPVQLRAQGITTGAIAGLVTDEAGAPLNGVQVVIRNRSTGFTVGSQTREDGRYRVQNLEPGGPYSVTARRIGLTPQTQDNLNVPLSQTLTVNFRLGAQVAQLGNVNVVATANAGEFSATNTGTRTSISGEILERVPSTSRNITDYVKVTPQVSTTGPGASAGGLSNRMNNVQIDGATERDVFGLGSTGAPGAEVNSKSISVEAVKELQVLLAPFDVRQGNFGGFLLNAITKNGTNEFHGSAFHAFRNQSYGADTAAVRGQPFNRSQTGFSLGGPILKDKLHFFTANEWTTENTPVSGPYADQPASAAQKFPIQADTLARFLALMKQLGSKDVGSAGGVNIPNPLTNVFARLDYRINDVHRLVLRYNYSDGERLRQQTARTITTAVLSDNFHNFRNVKSAPVVQLFSNFASGASNELFVGYNKWFNRRDPLSAFPQIRVNTVAGVNGTSAILAGADQFSQGNQLDTKTWEVTENFTFRPMGNHTFTVGTRNEYVWLRNAFTQSSYGVWSFRNLDSMAVGNANSFRKAIILKDGGNVYYTGLQNALYAQDQWTPTSRLAITAGLRFDVSSALDDVGYNAPIDSAYGRRTDEVPKRSLQYSPRVGFNWDVTGDRHNQVRGGIGLFVGTPPYIWMENAYVNSGNVITFLNCNTNGSTAPAPAFQADPSPINTCRNGAGTKPIGDVNLLAKDLKFPQPLRMSLAYDRQLPWNLIGTVEGLYSRTLNQLFFVNLNTGSALGTSSTGRTVYASVGNPANGQVTLIPPASVIANGGTARFSTAVDLQNQNKDYAYNLTAQLRKRYADNWEALVAYTYSRARDVQSFTSSTALSNAQFGRTLSGPQEVPYTGISLFDQPHKINALVSRTFEWKRNFGTDVTLVYNGVSGAPHDYVYASSGGSSSDMNGDGYNTNDLFYVPKNALDPNEIQFRAQGTRTPATQAQDLESFIAASPCLSQQRGRIMTRNSCRNPFTHVMDLSVRQQLPTVRGERVSVQWDIFNFGNLLNKNWGKLPFTPATINSNVPLVTHVGWTGTGCTTTPAACDIRTAVPVVQFTPPSGGEYAVSSTSSSNFWRSQLGLRLEF